ncbi:hypothetical protein GWI33_009625 [Rhynchophorus ferrugineus]|uniref:Uncharacterized protein n=1 Tax=Rhynchophorus ferrugineus TaxID=354439 RepID=A0A834IE40_RHYFE|nr:hypothetical protein GWI33_009625 [Rhynchophorus ferrugineus]
MKQYLLVSALLGIATCARLDNLYLPPGASGSPGPSRAASPVNNIPILQYSSENEGEGTYRYSYETANKINVEEQGNARGAGTKARGSFSYTSPEGQLITLTYTADENGFIPHGPHLPTPPPIPEAILKSLEINAAAEARGSVDNGQYSAGGASSAAAYPSQAANGGYRY